jgi:hypothetical protein
MEPDMILEYLAHEPIHAASHRSQQHELVAAILIHAQGFLDGIQLASQFAHALQQLQPLSIMVGHLPPPVFDNSHPQYGINPAGI